MLVRTTATFPHRLPLAMVYMMTERERWELKRAPHERASCLFLAPTLRMEVLLSLAPSLPSNSDA